MYPLTMSVTILQALQELLSLWIQVPYLKQGEEKMCMEIDRNSSTYVQMCHTSNAEKSY